MHSQTKPHQPESLLLQSLVQYGNILDFLWLIDREIGTASASELLELSVSLTDLQGIATQTDLLLLAQLNADPARSDEIQNLINKREHIVKDILLLNEQTAAKASGVKSLIANEMGKLRSGISALGGYRQHRHNQGRIVNSSS
jgi:hypothetical protein